MPEQSVDARPGVGGLDSTSLGLPDTGNRPSWWVSETDGEILHLHGLGGGSVPHETQLLAAFPDDSGNLVSPAGCVLAGLACWEFLPDGLDSYVDLSAPDLVSYAPRWGWAGETIRVGPHQLPFGNDLKSGIAAYHQTMKEPLSGATARLELGGELGPYSDATGLPLANVTLFESPSLGTVLDLSADFIAFRWDRKLAGILLLEVTGDDLHRLYPLGDDGRFDLATRTLGSPELGDTIELVAWRWLEQTHDVHGNQIVARSIVRGGWAAAWSHPATCRHILEAEPTTPTGTYLLQPDPLSPPAHVRCDMETDGGGWTQVAHSRGVPLRDEAGPWHRDLGHEAARRAHPGVWDALRPHLVTDVRFSCRYHADDAELTVDLSFYGVDWYQVITTGSDAQSCFLENDGVGFDTAPARRDNLSGAFLPEGSPWLAGYLEGEDLCRDSRDFTVDLADRGMDGDQSDGTDWGADDDMPKCGTEGATEGSWSIWVR